MARSRVIAVVVVAALAAGVDAAEEAKPLSFETKRVVVFKDGYALMVKEAPVTVDADGIAFTDAVPDNAILGSFWATPSKGRILSMIAGRTERKTEEQYDGVCVNVTELLKANIGRKVTIERQNKETLSGTVKLVLEEDRPDGDEAPAAPAMPVAVSSRSMMNYFQPVARPTVRAQGANFFVVDTGAQQVALAVSDVKTLSVEGLVTKMTRTKKKTESVKRLAFHLDKDARAKGTSMSLMHFGPGIRWIPTYRVDIGDGKRARIDLQGELLNEAEDVVDAAFDLVVGVPNFRFKGVISPLSLERAIRNTLRQSAPQLMGQQMSNVMFQQRAAEFRGPRRGGDDGPGDIALPEELTAGGSQDLFVYSMPKITLRKGQRAAAPIFTATVPFRHVYTWDVKLQHAPFEAAPGGGKRPSPVKLLKNDVWHQVALTNATDKPWTTGAALLMDGAMPLSQELLTYTSAGGRVLVPVTVAVDVRGTYAEKETGRERNALRFDGYTYVKVVKKGTLTLTNYKDRDIDVVVTCNFGGQCDTASDKGDITHGGYERGDWTHQRAHPALNPHSTVRWEFDLKKGKSKTVNVEYHYYTR